MKRTPTRYTLLIALSLLTVGLVVVGSSTGLAAEAEESREIRETNAEEHPRNLTFSGSLVDAETGEPLAEATFDVLNLWVEDGERAGRAAYAVTTDADGSFSVNVSEGELALRIGEDGYQNAEANFAIEDNLTMEIPMEPVADDRALVEGTVTDEAGNPIEDATVRLNLVPEDCEKGRDCEEPGDSRSSEGASRQVETEQGPVEITYHPDEDNYARTSTDGDGRYEVHVSQGTYRVTVRASDHLSATTNVDAQAGGSHQVDVELTAIPAASVTVEGQIVDQETGDPIPHADVRLDNQRWGTHNATMTDEDGRYQVTIQPGHTIVEIAAEESYFLACEEKQRDSDADQPREESCDPRQQREQAYLPVSDVIVPEQDETLAIDEALQPKPEPDTRIEGWVLNATSDEAIEGAQLRFQNEETGEWGHAETGEDGSYTIALDEGYYTVEIRADGYFGNATNLQVDGEDQVSFELRPGEPVDRYHHPVVYEQDEASYDGGDGDATASRSTEAGAPSEAGGSGDEVYAGGPGQLGSPPSEVGSDPAQAPGVSAAGLLAAIVCAGWVARRRS